MLLGAITTGVAARRGSVARQNLLCGCGAQGSTVLGSSRVNVRRKKNAPPLTNLRAMLPDACKPTQQETGMSNTEAIAKKIMSVAYELERTGKTGASTGEVIAAALVMNRLEFLPQNYTVLEAWDRLESHWQRITLALHKTYGYQFKP